MDRNEFGALVQVLRKQQQRLSWNKGEWSQASLAAKANLSTNTLGNIERGERVNLDASILQALAGALKLTSLEKQEFYYAASGVPEGRRSDVVYKSAQRTGELFLNYLTDIPWPAYISDVYGGIVAVNHSIRRLYGITDQIVEEALQISEGANTIRLFFDPKLGIRELFTQEWPKLAIHNIQFFRRTSLRYRATERFDRLLELLWDYPEFRTYWFEAYEVDSDNFYDSQRYEYFHAPLHKAVAYIALVSSAVTNLGELYSVVYAPLDGPTTEIFENLYNEGPPGMQRISEWPTI